MTIALAIYFGIGVCVFLVELIRTYCVYGEVLHILNLPWFEEVLVQTFVACLCFCLTIFLWPGACVYLVYERNN